MNDFELANKYLKIYYDKAKDKLPFDSFDDFKDHYRIDKFLYENYGEKIIHDDFFIFFEKALSFASSSDRQAAMIRLANQTEKDKTPSNQSFYDALSDRVESFTFQDAIEVGKNSAKDVGKVALAGLGLWTAKVLGGVLVAYYFKKYLEK